MIVIKEKFELLKDIDNILNLSQNEINNYSVKNGVRKAEVQLKMETKISHYGKDTILNLLIRQQQKSVKQLFAIVNIPTYPLPVTFNRKTGQIIINLGPLGTDDISATNPDPRNLYSSLLYGYTFYSFLTGKIEINKKISPVIISYLSSVFIRLFGKDYGFLTTYSSEIPKFKFLLSCYILKSFFGFEQTELYRSSAAIAGYDYRPIESELDKFNFSSIDSFISSLSNLKVMPGLNKHVFASKFYKILTPNFLPALEDLSRFLSIIATSTVSGTTIVPSFIGAKYNRNDYNSLVRVSKTLFPQ